MALEISVQQHLLPAVVILSMVTVGMELRLAQFKSLVAAPRSAILGTLIHTFSFPAVAAGLVLGIREFDLQVAEATLAGILLIAACPSGGFSNVLVLMARANLPLSIVLTAVSSLLAFVTVPLLIAAFAFILSDLDRPVELPVGATLIQLVVLILLPIAAGMILRRRFSTWIDQHLRRLQNITQLCLYVAVALLIAENFSVVSQYTYDALPWSIALCAINMFACYQAARLFKLDIEDRVTITLEGSIRNLAIALLIAVNVLERMDIAVLPTVYFISVLILAISFAKLWRYFLRAPAKN